MQGEYGTRVLASVDVDFLKQTMMVGFITSDAKKAATVSLRDVWLPCVIAMLQSQDLIAKDATKLLDAQRRITWGNKGALSKKKSKIPPMRPPPLTTVASEKIEVGEWS
jgi:hypothetical protein